MDPWLASLELPIVLCQPPWCWDYRYAPSCLNLCILNQTNYTQTKLSFYNGGFFKILAKYIRCKMDHFYHA
jgi:hypothetical protein